MTTFKNKIKTEEQEIQTGIPADANLQADALNRVAPPPVLTTTAPAVRLSRNEIAENTILTYDKKIKEQARDDLRAQGIETESMSELYRRLTEDKNKKSESFQQMERAVGMLINLKEHNVRARKDKQGKVMDYRDALSFAEMTVRSYKADHASLFFIRTYPADRYRISCRLLDLITGLKIEVNGAILKDLEGDEEEKEQKKSSEQDIGEIIDTGAFSAEEKGKALKDWLENDKQYKEVLKRIVGNKEELKGDKEVLLKFLENKNHLLVANKVTLSLVCDQHTDLTFYLPGMKKKLKDYIDGRLAENESTREMIYSEVRNFASFLNKCVEEYREENAGYLKTVKERRDAFAKAVKGDPADEALWGRAEVNSLLTDESIPQDVFEARVAMYAEQKKDNDQIVDQMVDAEGYSSLLSTPLKARIREKLGAMLIFGGELLIADQVRKYLDVKNYLCAREVAAEDNIVSLMKSWRIPTIQKDHFAVHLAGGADAKSIEKLSNVQMNQRARDFSHNMFRSNTVINKSGIRNRKLTFTQWTEFDAVRRYPGNYSTERLKQVLNGIKSSPTDGGTTMTYREFIRKNATTRNRGIGLSERLLGDQFLQNEEITEVLTEKECSYLKSTLMIELFGKGENLAFLENSSALRIREMGGIMRENIKGNIDKIRALRADDSCPEGVRLKVILKLAAAGSNTDEGTFERLLKQEREEYEDQTALRQEMDDVRECARGVPKSREVQLRTEKVRKYFTILKSYEKGRYELLAREIIKRPEFYREIMSRTEEELPLYIATELDTRFLCLGEALRKDHSGSVIQRRFLDKNFEAIAGGKLAGSVMDWKRRLEGFYTGEISKTFGGGGSIEKNISEAANDAFRKIIKSRGKDACRMPQVLSCTNHVVLRLMNDGKQFNLLQDEKKLRDRIVSAMELAGKNRVLAASAIEERVNRAASPFFQESRKQKKIRAAQFGQFVSEQMYDDEDFEDHLNEYIRQFEAEQLKAKGEEKAPDNIEEIRQEILMRQDNKDAQDRKKIYIGLDNPGIEGILNDIYTKKSLVNIGTKNNVDLSHASRDFVRDQLTARIASLCGADLSPMVINCIVEKNLAGWGTELLGRTPALGWILKKLKAEGSVTVEAHAMWLSRVQNVLSQPDEGEDPVEEDELNLMLVNIFRNEDSFKVKGKKMPSLDRSVIKGPWYKTFRENYKELKKLENMRVSRPSLEQERIGLSRDLRALLATGLGIKDQDSKAERTFKDMAERSCKYIGFVSSFYDLIGERMEKSENYAGLNEYSKNVYIERIRSYFNAEFLFELTAYGHSSIVSETNKWTGLVDRLLQDPVRMKLIKSAEQSISGEKEAARNRNFGEVAGREMIDRVIEQYGWKGQKNKYNALTLEQKELFALGLMIMDKSALGLDGGSNEVLNAPSLRKREIAVRLSELAKFMEGRAYDFRIDYGQAYHKLLNYGYNSVNSLKTKLSDTAFDKAMAFAEGISNRMNAATEKDITRIEDTDALMEEAALLGKTINTSDVQKLRKVDLEYRDVIKQLKYYADADGKKVNSLIGLAKAIPLQEKQLKKESALIEKVSGRLSNLTEQDKRRLVVILQNRTVLDMSSVEKGKHINEEKRDELKLMLSNDEHQEDTARFLTGSGCYKALLTSLSYHVKDDARLGDRALTKANFEARSFDRGGQVDWILLDNAFKLMDELDKESLARYAVRNAKDFIEHTGNEKAIAEYEKIKTVQGKELKQDQMEAILRDQAWKDTKEGTNEDAMIAMAGFAKLTGRQKNLFFRVLQQRDLLDISKKNLYRNIWSASAERGFVNEAGRFRLIDEYIDSSKGGNDGIVLKEGEYYEAMKSLLSTQVDDTVNFKSTEDVKSILAGEWYFFFQRDTAIDWKLFNRALQFVNRAEYELKIREGNAELYRAGGSLSSYGHMSMDYSILRRNIHNTGNQFLRFGVQRTKETLRKDIIPGIKGAKTVKSILSYTADLLPKGIADMEREVLNELFDKDAKNEVTKSRPAYMFRPGEINAKTAADRKKAREEHITEIDHVKDKIDAILENARLMEKGAAEVGKALGLSSAPEQKAEAGKEDVIAAQIKGHEAGFRYGDLRDDIGSVKKKINDTKEKAGVYLKPAKAVAKAVGYDLDEITGEYLDTLKVSLIERFTKAVSGEGDSRTGIYPAILKGYEREKKLKLQRLENKALKKEIESGRLKKGDSLDPEKIAAHEYWSAEDEELESAEQLKATEDVAKDYFAEVLKGMFGEEKAEDLQNSLKLLEDFTDCLRIKMTWITSVLNTARSYTASFTDVVKRVSYKKELENGKKEAESVNVRQKDKEKIEKAAEFQNEEQKELTGEVIKEHQDLGKIASRISGNIQDVEISRDLLDVAVQTGLVMAVSLGAGSAAVNMVSSAVKTGVDLALYAIRVTKDKNALRDYYRNTETGKSVVNGIRENAKALFGVEAENHKHIRNDHVLRLVCAGQGYEKEEELMTDTGMKLAASIAYSASNYNPILENKIIATTVMTVLGLKEKAGRTDAETIAQIFDAMKAA